MNYYYILIKSIKYENRKYNEEWKSFYYLEKVNFSNINGNKQNIKELN